MEKKTASAKRAQEWRARQDPVELRKKEAERKRHFSAFPPQLRTWAVVDATAGRHMLETRAQQTANRRMRSATHRTGVGVHMPVALSLVKIR